MTERTVVAFVTSISARRRLDRLSRALSLRLQCCATIDDVVVAVARLSAGALLTPACDEAGTPVAPALRRIKRLAPTLGIVVLLGPRCPSNIALAALRVADDALFDADLRPASLWFAINRAATRRRRPVRL